MSPRREWIGMSIGGSHSAAVIAVGAVAMALAMAAGCGAPPCERPTLELDGDGAEPLRKDRRVQVRPSVLQRESHIRVGCTAEWSGEGGVRVSVCALGRCTRAEGRQAYVDLWPRDWDRLPDLDQVYCFVIQKERQIFEGPWFAPRLVETLPERPLLVARFPVQAGCRAAPEGPAYCASGRWQDDRWICDQWTR
jgi:hypothetical protein